MLASRERLVVDASVAIKWVVAERDAECAATLLDHGLIVPDLLFSECANILWRKLRHHEITEDEAGIAARTLEQADVAVVSAKDTWHGLWRSPPSSTTPRMMRSISRSPRVSGCAWRRQTIG
jgi:predicted nucleic acid-binding protein